MGQRPRLTQTSAAKRRSVVAEVAKQVSSRSRRPFPPLKRVVMGTGRHGGEAVQFWVKPEVNPPKVDALPRES
jgi:hypothetical protein